MILLKSALILEGDSLVKRDILIDRGVILEIGDAIPTGDFRCLDVSGCWVIPGAIDVHAHFREPGFEHKATIATETASAAKGGILTALAMPNLKPVPDCAESIRVEQGIINKSAKIRVYPYASLSKGERGHALSDFDGMQGEFIAISDDGVGVNNTKLLLGAMKWAKENDALICSHAEAEGYGTSREAEYLAVRRELELQRATGCKYHFCHLSVKESFDALREAVAEGADVTAEVTPHHLCLTEEDIKDNTNFKMNPPLRTLADRQATEEAFISGLAGIAATDHAPHSEGEKMVAYDKAPNGILGFETMLPVLFDSFVMTKKLSYKAFLDRVVYNPARRFNLPQPRVAVGEAADLAVLDIAERHIYQREEILSKSKNSPFIGRAFYGFNVLTLMGGEIIYKDNKILEIHL